MANKTKAHALGKPMSILVADDHFANRLLTQSLLQREGHAIALANNGKEAVQACMAQPYDLILLDIQMPIMDGIQALKLIKALNNGNEAAPTFALTAHTRHSEIRTLLSMGFEAVLLKPFRVAEMMSHLGGPGTNANKRASAVEETTNTDVKLYGNTLQMPLLEVQTLDILLGAIGPKRMCKVLTAYWLDADSLMASLKTTRITTQLGAETELMKLRKTAHGLKGASANIGLLKASRLAAHLQNAPIEDIPYLVETLGRTLHESQTAIRDYCGLAGSPLNPELAAAS